MEVIESAEEWIDRGRSRVVRPVRVDHTGRRGPTQVAARGPRWRQPYHGWHVPSDVEITPEQRTVEAAALIRPGAGAVTGWAALRWLGGRWFDGSTISDPAGLPVELAMWGDVRPRPGITLCEERLKPRDVLLVGGIPVTCPARSVAFAMRYADTLSQAVQAMSMAAYDDLVSLDEARDYAGEAPRQGLSGWTGIPRCRLAMTIADENCWSPAEASMLAIWMAVAELPRPLMNHPVFDLTGRRIGTPDLLDVVSGTVCEYDGRLHLEGEQRARDARRDERYAAVGLERLTVLAGDLAQPDVTAARMRAARDRARWEPASRRAWTAQPPSWWIPTVTVAQRRALTSDQRSWLLRHRAA